MNSNIRRLGILFLAAFAVIIGDVTYWQVIDASNITSRPDNRRLIVDAELVRRGLIYDRNGVLLAGRTIDSQGFVHRYYTDPSLSQIIGYDSPRYGKSGLERYDDAYLDGTVYGSSWTTFFNRLEHKPVVGNNLTLTIEDQLQKEVTNFLPNSPSAAIVADPRNGEILAMASKPGFDANQINNQAYWNSLLNDPNAPFINRPINGFYPPGSIFKIVTLSAALDSGALSLNSIYSGQEATGPLNVEGHVFPDTINNLNDCGGRVITPPIDLEEALICSDNIVFAQVGLTLGQNRFLDYAHRFGLDSAPPFDLPVSPSHVMTPGESFDQVALASTSFGQGGLHVTPMQMLMATEAIADGGSIPDPVLVKSISAADGSSVKGGNYGTFGEAISSGTASQVKSAMVQVVAQGTGILASIPGVTIAGKTGTAEANDPQNPNPHAWFIAFAPADHPKIALVVIVEHGGEGATVAAPIAKEIMQAALPLVH